MYIHQVLTIYLPRGILDIFKNLLLYLDAFSANSTQNILLINKFERIMLILCSNKVKNFE